MLLMTVSVHDSLRTSVLEPNSSPLNPSTDRDVRGRAKDDARQTGESKFLRKEVARIQEFSRRVQGRRRRSVTRRAHEIKPMRVGFS
jgi:hypothetical protein